MCTGPVVDHIKSEASRAGNELRDLRASSSSPSSTTATGQPLTCMCWDYRLSKIHGDTNQTQTTIPSSIIF